jgi:hypothetical protein
VKRHIDQGLSLPTISEAVFARSLTLCFNQDVFKEEVLKESRMSGQELFDTLVENTGLPEEYVRARLSQLLNEKGLTMSELKLDNMREILADLLLDLIQQSTAS